MKRSTVNVASFVGLCLLAALASFTPAQATAASSQVNVWVGSEDLGGYGRLEFQFYPGGRVVMIDAREVSEGYCNQNGNSITVTFPGRATYYGTINGNNMSGTGRDNTRTWNFNLQYQRSQ